MASYSAEVLLIFVTSTIISVQPEEQFYFDDFSLQSDWIIENTGNGDAVQWEDSGDSGRCNQLASPLCLFVPGQGLVSRVISSVGYHTLKIEIDCFANGNEKEEFCYLEYQSSPVSWTTVDLLTGTINQLNMETIIPDIDDYNDQASFEVRLGHSGDTGGDACFFDNLRILGIPYPTTNPTPAPTTVSTNAPTAAPADLATAAPTSIPTVSTMFPTQAPTNGPSSKATIESTDNPTSDPASKAAMDPTANPTSAPTNNPTIDLHTTASMTSYSENENHKTLDVLSLIFISISGIVLIAIIIIAIKFIKEVKHGKAIYMADIEQVEQRHEKQQRVEDDITIPRTWVELVHDREVVGEADVDCEDALHTETHGNIAEHQQIGTSNAETDVMDRDIILRRVVSDGSMTNANGQILNDHDVVAARKHTADLLEVKSWLDTHVKLPIYYDIFINNGYETLSIIKEVNDEWELESIGILSKEHRVRILKEIEKLWMDFEGNAVELTAITEHDITLGNVEDEGCNLQDDEFIVQGDEDDKMFTTRYWDGI